MLSASEDPLCGSVPGPPWGTSIHRPPGPPLMISKPATAAYVVSKLLLRCCNVTDIVLLHRPCSIYCARHMHRVQRCDLLLPVLSDLSVCLCVCLFIMSFANVAELIALPFRMWTQVGPRNHVLGGSPAPLWGRGNWGNTPRDAAFYQNYLAICSTSACCHIYRKKEPSCESIGSIGYLCVQLAHAKYSILSRHT